MSLTRALLYFHGQVARCVQGTGECERQGITPVYSEVWQEPKVRGTVEPRFNEVLDITNDTLSPGLNYSKMY